MQAVSKCGNKNVNDLKPLNNSVFLFYFYFDFVGKFGPGVMKFNKVFTLKKVSFMSIHCHLK